jgi:hypothetical protein
VDSSKALRVLRHVDLPPNFVIVMEALSRMMSAAVHDDFISGFSVGARSDDLVSVLLMIPSSVSHLHFVDMIPSFFVE